MSNMESLRITVKRINSMLDELGSTQRVRVGRSYGKVHLYIVEGDGERDTKPRGPKECLMYAEGMERGLEILYFGKER